MNPRLQREPGGPFRADQIRSGDPYELSNGHAIRCFPVGADGAKATALGLAALASDPAVEEAGTDAGYTTGAGNLRAPDVAIGNVPSRPGWIPGVPPLAVEYAGKGQDEETLATKIDEFLRAGTQHIWVVRLVGPRRVEVHEPGKRMRMAGPGDVLDAPGILQNPVPIEVLYDPDASRRATLRNLVQREGYADFDEALKQHRDEGFAEGLEAGRAESARALLLALIEQRFGPPPAQVGDAIAAASYPTLLGWTGRLLSAPTAQAVVAG